MARHRHSFALTRPSQFRAVPTPALTSCRYARDYNEVKALGGLVNSARTAEQTDLAYFFSDNYVVLWNRALRDIAVTYLNNTGDSARLFALITMAMADAGITAWDTKRHYVFWRPITAIQEGDKDGNPRTVFDPTWQPLINTPPYPDYTSGANNVNAAAARIVALFFGTDRLTFSLNSGNPNVIQKTRTYCRLSEETRDVVNARIYEGIHFRFADVAGRRQGRQVAKWAFQQFLRPFDNDCDGGKRVGTRTKRSRKVGARFKSAATTCAERAAARFHLGLLTRSAAKLGRSNDHGTG